MKYCEHCGKEIEGGSAFCQSCGAAVAKEENKDVNITVNNNAVNNQPSDASVTNGVKDNTTLGFILSIVGALCCTYVAIPGLIICIQSLQQMKEGKISDKNKWMAIVGIVLSAIGLVQMIWNFTHLNENSERIQEMIDKINGSTN